MLKNFEKIIIVTGHYGSGKTNLSINLALDLKKTGKQVILVDLDIVNPYFRTADFINFMKQRDIHMITPLYANTNLDIPSITSELDAVIGKDSYLVIDVGGDDAGALALGRYSEKLSVLNYDMIYVVNRFRYLTRMPSESCELLHEIELASKLKANMIVNNSNLCDITTKQDIVSSFQYAKDIAECCKIEQVANAVQKKIVKQLSDEEIAENNVYAISVYVKKIWESQELDE